MPNEQNLNAEFQYIVFLEMETESKKTKRWSVANKESGYLLGFVEWYSAWRQYCFMPTSLTVFSKGCLNDISDFLKEIKNVRK